jgi:hypothetical protein
VHVTQVFVDAPFGMNGGNPGDQTPFAQLAWDCQCLATSFASDGALIPAPSEVADALVTPEIRVVLTKTVVPNIETVVMKDAGAYGLLDLKNHPVVTMTTTSGMTAIGLDGFYDPESSPVSLPPGPSLVVFPAAPLASGTEYQISVQKLIGEDDNAPFSQPAGGGPDKQTNPAAFTTKFTTQPLVILQQSPADLGGVSAMAPDCGMVQLIATAPLDPATMTTTAGGTATVTATGVPLPGAWTADPTTPNAVDFTPTATGTCAAGMGGAFAPATTYTVTVTTGVKDTGGAALSAGWTQAFTTM